MPSTLPSFENFQMIEVGLIVRGSRTLSSKPLDAESLTTKRKIRANNHVGTGTLILALNLNVQCIQHHHMVAKYWGSQSSPETSCPKTAVII